ncbi:hypothetical protein XENORESO_004923 [Xenotaenia resolanae]|uniref:Aminopeptidase N-like N-terminal domain-containing protein n=1 Tax=Xenotaenia resolanae TaxID=208358 RepID=A0ABV0W255_9TELE
MRIHRHFPYTANQMYVVVLHRELKPMRVYRLNVSFDAAIEDELLGFFRSSYTLQRERRFIKFNDLQAADPRFSPVVRGTLPDFQCPKNLGNYLRPKVNLRPP